MAREEVKDKEYFYDHVISPYKGKVESWYVENQSLELYFRLIGLTIWAVVFSSYVIHYENQFKNFPEAPDELHMRKTHH